MSESRRSVFMVCNAHLDPVWLWEWEEGAAAAISTFRTAADLCEEFEGFVFNHNEVILYRWVEEYEPALFARIQRMVKAGKWHIMGGWFLQPDCNMPSGESFVRQILLGRRYFDEKFGVRPTTALNLDPFGHTRGLAQILARSGFDSYLFCRPYNEDVPLEQDNFVWVGYDGSRVLACRAPGHYNSMLGKAREKIEGIIESRQDVPEAMALWGVGNHGGGPSRVDLRALAELIGECKDVDVRHSTPEEYFAALKTHAETLPVREKDINPWAVGCYTSQVRIKQKHRRLENELYLTEKMASAAWANGSITYPADELTEAMRDLAYAEFHDILPGSSIQPVEETALRLMDHGLELLSRVKARAFFALAAGQPAAKTGETPILVYNPHPYPVKTTVECEFQLEDFNWTDTFTDVQVLQGEQTLPTQVEKELSSLNLDWRKRVVFQAELAPAQMNRFDCRFTRMEKRPARQLQAEDGFIHFQTGTLDVLINTSTGLIDRYRVNGVDYLSPNAACPVVVHDDPDPWGMRVQSYRNTLGAFTLLAAEENQRFSGVLNPALPAVRVIEDGAARSVVEAVLGWGDSRVCLRYKLPKQGTEIEVEARVHWNEKDRMLKLSFPTPDAPARLLGQVAYGMDELPTGGKEAVAQKWAALVSRTRDAALTVINEGTYGCDLLNNELRLTLMRSPAYSGHPIGDRPLLPDDRYSPRIDQGERLFRFWVNAGPRAERLEAVDREALVRNEFPMALSFFPVGGGEAPGALVTLSDPAVLLTALKKAEGSEKLILRLFEPTGQPREVTVRLPGMERIVKMGAFEIRTFAVDIKTAGWVETNLIEEIL